MKNIFVRLFVRARLDIPDLTCFRYWYDISPNTRYRKKKGSGEKPYVGLSRACFRFYARRNDVRENANCGCCIRNDA